MKQFLLAMTYLIEFTVCAFCGWLYEEGLELAVCHAYADRGVLHLPLLPIYGFGGLLLVLLYRKRSDAPFVFVTAAVVSTILELAASYPLEYFLGWLPWDYSAWFCNFEGRISLPSSLIFGGLALLLVKVVHPLCRKLESAPQAPVIAAGCICAAAFAIDCVCTWILHV